MDYSKDGGGTDVTTPTPQTMAEALVTQFFNQLQQRVPNFGAITAAQRLSPEQQTAVDLIKALGAGLAVRDFTTIAPHLPARDDDGVLHVDVPDKAVKARIYSQNGVKEEHVHACGQLTVGNPLDRVVRIEFFDCKGAVIDVTGSEEPPPPQSSAHRTY